MFYIDFAESKHWNPRKQLTVIWKKVAKYFLQSFFCVKMCTKYNFFINSLAEAACEFQKFSHFLITVKCYFLSFCGISQILNSSYTYFWISSQIKEIRPTGKYIFWSFDLLVLLTFKEEEKIGFCSLCTSFLFSSLMQYVCIKWDIKRLTLAWANHLLMIFEYM